jgi:hypothetical protein
MRPALAWVCAAALAGGLLACGGDDSPEETPADAPGSGIAIANAEAYATTRGVEAPEGAQFLRSTRDPDWALVTGAAGRGIWAVWLRVEDGRWRPEHALLDGRGDSSPAEVPCDIKPPFSEPECPPRE